jgi:hypothetical protein
MTVLFYDLFQNTKNYLTTVITYSPPVPELTLPIPEKVNENTN